MAAKGLSPKQVDQQHDRVSRIFNEAQFCYWSDIQSGRLLQTIERLQKLQPMKNGHRTTGKPASQKTKLYHLKATKQFCRWMLQDGRAMTNPIEHTALNDKMETENTRRALSVDEITSLLAHVSASGPIKNIPGPERNGLYSISFVLKPD